MTTAIVDRHAPENQRPDEDDDPEYCDECDSCMDDTGECDRWYESEPFRSITGVSVEGFLPLFETDTLTEMHAMTAIGIDRGYFSPTGELGTLVQNSMARGQDIMTFMREGKELEAIYVNEVKGKHG